MKVRRLEIEQQLAQISVNSQMASLSIEMPKRAMMVENKRARMTVERQSADIEIDMEDFRNHIGLKTMRTLNEEIAVRASAQADQGIKEIANDAKFIGTLPAGGNPIAQLAKSKMLEQKAPELNTGSVPPGSVKMRGKPGEFSINWSKHDLKINWDNFQSPTITVEPKATVDVKLAQEPSIEYTVVEVTIPAETGKMIDAQA